MFIAAMVLWWEGDRRTVSLTSHFFWGAATEVIEHVGHGGSAEEKSLWAQLAARLHLNVTCETFNIFQLFCWFAPSIETCLWGEHRSCKWLASTSLCRWPSGTRSGGLVMMLWWDWRDTMMFQGLKCLKFDAFRLTNSDMLHLSQIWILDGTMPNADRGGQRLSRLFLMSTTRTQCMVLCIVWGAGCLQSTFLFQWMHPFQPGCRAIRSVWLISDRLVTSSNYQVNPVFDWHVWGFLGAGVTELDAPWLQSIPVAGLYSVC